MQVYQIDKNILIIMLNNNESIRFFSKTLFYNDFNLKPTMGKHINNSI